MQKLWFKYKLWLYILLSMHPQLSILNVENYVEVVGSAWAIGEMAVFHLVWKCGKPCGRREYLRNKLNIRVYMQCTGHYKSGK